MRISSRAIKALLASLTVSGCASLPDLDTPTIPSETPTSWEGRADGSGPFTPNEWWRNFGDPLLDATVAEAVGENTAVWVAKAQAAQARAQAAIAGADGLPSVSAGLSGQEQRLRSPTSGHFNSDEAYGAQLNVDWEIDLWGRLAAQTEAARESYLASIDGLRSVRQSIAAQTVKTYFAVVETQQQVELSQRALGVMTETARQVGNRSDVGIGSPSDKYLALSNRDSAAAGLAGNQEAWDQLARQLEVLVSDYPAGTVRTANNLVGVPPLPALGLPADLLARRPDVAAAEKQLRAAGFNVVSARRSLLPAISLTGGVQTSSSELRNILDGNFSIWTLAGNLIQPIFQGGRLLANVDLNEAIQQEAANNYVSVVLNAFSEVETALARRADIEKRRAALCSGAEASLSAEKIAFNRYRQGVEPFLTVLEAQQRALNDSSSCISAQRDEIDNYIDLMLALGGGFEEEAPTPESIGSLTERHLEALGEEASTILTGN